MENNKTKDTIVQNTSVVKYKRRPHLNQIDSKKANSVVNLVFEISRTSIIACLFVLILREPRFLLLPLAPLKALVLPGIIIFLLSKLFTWIFRFVSNFTNRGN